LIPKTLEINKLESKSFSGYTNLENALPLKFVTGESYKQPIFHLKPISETFVLKARVT